MSHYSGSSRLAAANEKGRKERIEGGRKNQNEHRKYSGSLPSMRIVVSLIMEQHRLERHRLAKTEPVAFEFKPRLF
jgi:hypothetical protein